MTISIWESYCSHDFKTYLTAKIERYSVTLLHGLFAGEKVIQTYFGNLKFRLDSRLTNAKDDLFLERKGNGHDHENFSARKF
jgi:hypothetical protein